MCDSLPANDTVVIVFFSYLCRAWQRERDEISHSLLRESNAPVLKYITQYCTKYFIILFTSPVRNSNIDQNINRTAATQWSNKWSTMSVFSPHFVIFYDRWSFEIMVRNSKALTCTMDQKSANFILPLTIICPLFSEIPILSVIL